MRKQFYLAVIVLSAASAVHAEESNPDRVNVPLTDAARPAVVNVSIMNGGITVTGYAGKEVVVEARPRGRPGGFGKTRSLIAISVIPPSAHSRRRDR